MYSQNFLFFGLYEKNYDIILWRIINMNGNRGVKPPFISSILVNKIEKIMKNGGKPEIKTYDRRSTITPKLVGFTLLVYNGKAFCPLYVNEDMIGHKIGEFILTRNFKAHGGAKAPAGGVKKAGK